MAERTSLLRIVLNATDTGSKKVIGGAGNALSGLGNVALSVAAGGLAVVGTALSAMTDLVLSVGNAAFGVSQEFNSAMNLVQARTGAANEEMIGFGNTTLSLFRSNLGDNIEDVATSLATVATVTGESGAELESLTERALIMKKVFETDVQESIRAVDTATETFGETGEAVFDMVTKTIQKTGDPADDLLDTVNEYSTVFAQTGFSADEMFGILTSGLDAGARDFDVVADAIKEFQIRIIDGSSLTENALNDMFEAVGEGNPHLADLEQQLGKTELALDDNKAALEDAEGAYAVSKQVVDDLSSALDQAERELRALASPNLAGMKEFDDQLFDLDIRAKQARLAMLDMEKDTPEFEAAQANLDAINKEIDRLSLERDISLEPQLRAIEQAATEGLEPAQTFDQVMAEIGSKKEEISGLENAFDAATASMLRDQEQIISLEAAQASLIENIDQITSSIEAADSPAKEFLSGFTDGSLTGADAMSQVIQKLQEVEDPLKRNEIGVALFGTKWEDLGPKVILALDPAQNALTDFEGSTLQAGEAATSGLGNSWEEVKRTIITSLIPLGNAISDGLMEILPFIREFAERATPIFERFAVVFSQTLRPAMLLVQDALQRIGVALGITSGDVSGMDVALHFLDGVLDMVITGMELFAITAQGVAWAVEEISSAVQSASGWISGFGDRLDGLGDVIPDWLIPGSPPPLFFALRDIQGALRSMPDLQASFGFDNQDAPVQIGTNGSDTVDAPDPRSGQTIFNITIEASGRAEGEAAADGFLGTMRSVGVAI